MISETKKEEILKRLTEEPTVSQAEAAELLEVTPCHISNLIKKGKIKASLRGKTPKPYVKSVMEYKTQPTKKRIKK